MAAAAIAISTIIWYCYNEIRKDYISKWMESNDQLLSVTKDRNHNNRARVLVAIGILNKDLWAKKMFSSFFSEIVFEAFSKCKKAKLRKQLKTPDKLESELIKRRVSEEQIYDLLNEYLSQLKKNNSYSSIFFASCWKSSKHLKILGNCPHL